MACTDGLRIEMQDGVLRLLIDRPERKNAVGEAELRTLVDALTDVGPGTEVRAVLIGGVGSMFCAGIDLTEIAQRGVGDAVELVDLVNKLVNRILTCPVSTVAAVRGPALGMGVALALACDLTVVGDAAYLQLPFTQIGLMPDGGTTALVAASVGRARAMRLALLGDRVSAATAHAWGLVDSTHPDREIEAAAQSIAARLADGPTEALRLTAHAINDATLGDMDRVFAQEREGQRLLSHQPTFKAVLDSFLRA